MIESRYGIENKLLFRETFEGPDNTARLGGTITSVSYSNGIGTFTYGSSSIVYKFNGNIAVSIRIKYKITSVVNNQYLFDLRNTAGTGVFGLFCSVATGKLGGAGTTPTIYVDGVLQNPNIVVGQTYDIITTATLSGRTDMNLNVGQRYDAQKFFNGQIELIEIYKGILGSDEVQAIYNNSKYKFYNPIMDLNKWIKISGTFVEKYNTTANSIIGLGQKYFQCTSAGSIVIPNKQAFGTFEFTFYSVSTGNPFAIYLISDKTGTGSNDLWLYFHSIAGGVIRLFKTISGVQTNLIQTANNYFSTLTYYRLRLIRPLSGAISLYIIGGAYTTWTLVGTATESTLSNKFFKLSLTNGDRISDIRFTPYTTA